VASRAGIPNKAGAQVKENILAVFNRIGGTNKMAQWAERNLTEFYRLYARLMPTVMVGDFTFRRAEELSDDELADIATGRSKASPAATTGETEPSPVH
jgi:hypothetical protein